MKRQFKKIGLVLWGTLVIFSCNKAKTESSIQESLRLEQPNEESVSMAADQQVDGKKFIRKADVNMEVQDVYDATIFIENNLKEIGGFVAYSNYESMVEKENVYPQSDEYMLLLRKYYSINRMQVRVPTEKLMDFLKKLNEKSLFLHHRFITAEDVSANIKMIELERQRMQQHKNNLSKQVNNKENAESKNDNEREINEQKLQEMNLADELKYSTIDIFIKEPKTKISQIQIPNNKSQENQYHFWYDAKEAFSNGFYIFQRFLVFLVQGWLFIIVGVLGIYIWKKRKKS